MCRLLGIISDQPVDLEFSMVTGPRPFRDLGQEHPDGWGMGWYESPAPTVKKRALPAHESQELVCLASQTRSKIFVCHVRRSSCGVLSERNCHPFSYRKWLFAHNGTIHERDTLQNELLREHEASLKGQTDSEVLFHWILQQIEGADELEEGLRRAAESIKDYSALNFLLTDGASLYAYRDASRDQDKFSLYYLEREPGQPGEDAFSSKESNLQVSSKTLKGERAVLVCSEALTDEAWKEVPLGHLLMISPQLETHLVSLRRIYDWTDATRDFQ